MAEPKRLIASWTRPEFDVWHGALVEEDTGVVAWKCGHLHIERSTAFRCAENELATRQGSAPAPEQT